MNTSPQAVTERYVTNLLHHGQNKEFILHHVVAERTMIGDENVGTHFTVEVNKIPGVLQSAVGATPAQALRRALERHGVTFR